MLIPKAPLLRKQIVHVIWEDCQFMGDNWTDRAWIEGEARKFERIDTIGMLWKEVENYILVVGSTMPSGDKIFGTLKIPRSQIRKMKRLGFVHVSDSAKS